MAMRPLLLVPEMLVFGGGLLILIAGSFLPRERQWVTRVVAVAVLLGAIATAAAGLTGAAQSAFEGTFVVDTATGVARIVAATGVLLVLMLATDELADSPRESETYALLLFSTAGAQLLAGADDLLVLAVGFLLTSIPLYALIGLAGTARGAEAAMKTYLLGALCGIALLLGVTVLYAVTGSTAYTDLEQRLATAPVGAVAAGLVGVLAGLLFKAGAAPAHFWVPDAAEGASATVATFLTTVPKVGALVAVYRLVTTMPDRVDAGLLVALLAVASMTLGNLAAYWQSDPRRLLGWSTVSQVGYLLVPVAAAGASDLALPSLLVYLAGYTVTNIAAFAVTAALPGRRELSAWRGLAGARPWLAGALVVALLGLVGTPPTVVFVGKLTTATAAWDGGYAWLALVLLGNTVLSLFYYLRWIVPVLGRGEGTARTMRGAFVPAAWSGRTAVLAGVVTVVLGLASGALWGAVDGVTR
jgi:NADH-quinone oxidoreductase subunit N